MYIGICGLSGSGKSSLAKYLLDKYNDYLYLDIDKIGHEVNEYLEVKEKLVNTFGDILTNDKVDRKKLGRVVFNNQTNMDKLVDITWEYMERRIDEIIKDHKKIIFDWMLLPKTKYFKECDLKILLDIPKDIRMDRIIKRDSISKDYFELRDKNGFVYNYDDFNIILTDNNYQIFDNLEDLNLHKNY